MAALLYVGSLGNGFAWDDAALIVRNPNLGSFEGVWRSLGTDLFAASGEPANRGYWRPLVTLSFAADRALWGPGPRGFHLTNLLLHAACSLLAALLARRLLGGGAAPALLTGLLFALHPVHAENVAFVSGRTDLLAFLLGCSAILLHLGGCAAPVAEAAAEGEPPRQSARRVVAACALYLLALLAKEMAVVAVAWLAAVELLQRRRSCLPVARGLVPFLVTTLVYVALRFVVLRVPLSLGEGPGAAGVLLTAPVTLARYLLWLAVPFDLQAFVLNPPVTSPLAPRLLWSLVALALAGVGAAAVWRRSHACAALTAMTLLALLPLLHLLPIKGPADMGLVMAERFLYFASWPFVALAVQVAPDLTRRIPAPSRRVLLVLLATVVSGWWAALVMARVPQWRDDVTLFTGALAQAPEAPTVIANLANAWAERGDLGRAGEVVERAPASARRRRPVQIAWSQVLASRGRYREAVVVLEEVLRTPGFEEARARNNLGCLYRLVGRPDDAVRLLEALVAEGRDLPETHINLAEAHRSRGDAERAWAAYERGVSAFPADPTLLAAYADFEASAGRREHAAALLRAGIAERPDDSALRSRLAGLTDPAAPER